MLNTLNVNLNTVLKVTRVPELGIKIKSQDINNNLFILRFTDKGTVIELDEAYTVEILTKFEKSKSHRLTSATVYRDYARWEFDTSFITQDEKVVNYVYVRKSGSLVVSADANAFAFDVGLSEIDKDAGRVAAVYDESYEALIAEFEQALEDYKLTLPQADSVRAEIDVILNQFGVDSQTKLNQYNDNAQQVIADNQMAFGAAETSRQDNYEQLETDRTEAFEQTVLGWNHVISSSQASFNTAEINRQNTYEQAEDIRNQASNQAVADWEQGAGELLSVKLSSIQSTADALLVQTVANFNTRADGAIGDKLIEFDTKTDQVLSPIELAESLRVIAEQQRQIKIAQLEAQLEIINKLVMKQVVVMGVSWGRSSSPTLERIEVL